MYVKGAHFHAFFSCYFQTLKRPGHDVEPAIVECNDPSHHTGGGGGGVAVMPKSSTGFQYNGWISIGVCTLLVFVFACTTLYYWQKAKVSLGLSFLVGRLSAKQ